MRYFSILIAFVLSLAMFGCPPPNPNNPRSKYAAGYTTVTMGKLVVQTAYTGFQSYVNIKTAECNDVVCAKLHPAKQDAYKTCMAEDHSDVAEYKTCYGKLGDVQKILDKAVPLALSVMQDVKEALDLAVDYEIAKEAAAKADDPEKLKTFCTTVFPAKTGDQYTKCLAGEPLEKTDWVAFLRGRACTVYYSLAFVPAPYTKYTDPVRAWFKSYGNCQ